MMIDGLTYQRATAPQLPSFLDGDGVWEGTDVDVGTADNLLVEKAPRRPRAAFDVVGQVRHAAGGGGEGKEKGEDGAAEGGERPGRERCQAEDEHPDCKSQHESLEHQFKKASHMHAPLGQNILVAR